MQKPVLTIESVRRCINAFESTSLSLGGPPPNPMENDHPATEITAIKIALFARLYSLSKELAFVFLRCKSANSNQVKSAILELSDKDTFKSTGIIAKIINE